MGGNKEYVERDFVDPLNTMAKTYEFRFPPSPNLDKITLSFDKLNNTDLFLQIHGVYKENTFI